MFIPKSVQSYCWDVESEHKRSICRAYGTLSCSNRADIRIRVLGELQILNFACAICPRAQLRIFI